MRHALPALLAIVALAGCDPTTPGLPPVGSVIDEGAFGAPTRRNMLLQRGELGYVGGLNTRFADAVTPMVTFPFDSAELTPGARTILREQANFIRQFPELTFSVYGHADLVGSEGYNYRLGLRRARAVVAYLAQQGVDTSRLEALVSFGEEEPLVPTTGRERRNRRTVTEVSGFVRSHPTVLNGLYAEVIFRDYVASAVEAPASAGIEAIFAPEG